MQCPVDQTVLQMTDRQGVEIDYCPQCRGVWLDRGELDKIIEKSEVQAAPAARPSPEPLRVPATARALPTGRYQQYPPYPQLAGLPDEYRGHGQGYDPRHGRKRRKESFLGDLFDF